MPLFPAVSVPPDNVPALVPLPSERLGTPLVGRESASCVNELATAERRWKDADGVLDLALAEVTVRKVDDPVASLAKLEELMSEALDEMALLTVADETVGVGVASVTFSLPVDEAAMLAASLGRLDFEAPDEPGVAEEAESLEGVARVDEL